MDFSSNYSPSVVGTTSYGDLVMINGDLVATSDADPRGTPAVLQDILFRIRTFQAEWFADTSLGVPWYQQLLGIKGGSTTLDAVLQNVILSTPGVLQLTRWSATLNPQTRVLQIAFGATTVSGQVSYDSGVTLGAATGA